MQKDNIIKVVILNFIIIITAIVAYSPGLLNLRPGDDSIFRAGMSIIIIIVLIFAFFYGNFELTKPKVLKRVNVKEISDIEKAEKLLANYFNAKYFGSTAKTAANQLDRLVKSFDKLKDILNERFEEGTMSHNKYMRVIESAGSSAIDNIVTMANRMQMFDENTYDKLLDYKNDDIPDDIQEKQLELYDGNMDIIKQTIAANENLLLKMDTLLMELAAVKDKRETELLLEEIEKLTNEVKYYQ